MKLHSTGRWRRALAGGAFATLLGATLVAPPAQAAVGTVFGAGRADAVAGSYVVVLKDAAVSAQSVAATADALAVRYGGAVAATYTSALRGFSARMSERAAQRLAADAAVAWVQQDAVLHAVDTQPNPPSWGLDRIDQRALPLNNSYTFPVNGSGVTAYVIDTGVRITHVDFGGRASHGRDTVSEDDDSTDCHGHGTHVAGTVAGTRFGVAKGARVVGVRVLGCTGSGTTTDIVQGIDWVTQNGLRPAVANMSLGGGPNPATDRAVAGSIASGITYAIAAGNSNGANACNFSPARVPEAITLGATAINDARSTFSNTGPCVDLFAPGQGITSAWITNDTATNTISGTSMASPHAAGVAALLLSASRTSTPQQIRDRMVADATPGVVGNPGTGSPNRLLFVLNGDANPPRSRHEAEDAQISQGTVDSNHAGFSGRGFVNYANAAGSFVQWTVTIVAGGQTRLTIRYANGTTANRPMDIAVDGTVATPALAFPGTGGWPSWSTATTTVPLTPGTHTIRATALTAAGGPNVDHLEIG